MFQLILKSLWHFKKQHLAVFAGTVISTAVLTGALIIGDSVRLSLQNLVYKRLGKTEYVLNTGGRFVRVDLAHEIARDLHIQAAPVLMLQGVAINAENKNKVNAAQVVGIDHEFWSFSKKSLPELKPEEAIISENVAQILTLKPGDEFLLRVESANVIPLNTPLARENKASVAMRLTVKAVANDHTFGRFSLRSNQSAPFNIYISREYLAEKLELRGLANSILFSGNQTAENLDSALSHHFQLTDVGLKLHDLPEVGKYELTSDRIFIDKQLSGPIENLGIPNENILTYLVNTIRCHGKETPYSFVTAASTPIVPKGLKKDDIIINEWLANDLDAKEGDSIELCYYVIGPLRTLTEKKHHFTVKKIIPTESSAADRKLMPSFPGLSDAGNCRDWNSGVPIDLKKIRDKDEKYWDDFRGTPKALIPIETGVELWSNPFGNLTAMRFDRKDISSLDTLQHLILKTIRLKNLGITIASVRNEGLSAAGNSLDFGELFLSLSFFIIVAAVLLTALIHSLNTVLRSQETAILAGLGFSRKRIIIFRFAESSVVIVAGGITGALAGILYNKFLVAGLNSVWHDAVRERMLEVHVQLSALAVGSISGILIALISIYIVTHQKLKQPVAELVKGSNDYITRASNNKKSKTLSIIGFTGAIVLVFVSIFTSSYENPALFLSAGALFLVGSIALIAFKISSTSKNKDAPFNTAKLVLRNIGRNRSRSLTAVSVLALGTYIIVLTGSYRKTFYGEENQPKSGTGGYSLWAETTMPMSFNLNSPDGRKNLVLDNDEDLNKVNFNQFLTLDGDDASCLNLNQVKRPRILGINPTEFDRRRAFSFVKLLNGVNKEHPWESLKSEKDDVIPAMADQTVIQYGLKKSVGDTLTYMDEFGRTIKLQLVGGLDNSIFQGSILIAEDIFRKYFPSAGSKVTLIEAPKANENKVSEIIRNSLSDFGVTIVSTTERLAEFNSVENTYLSVFMMLGGLGFLIGTIGLGIILYRNMLDRQYELGLLIALGYTKKQVFYMILREHIILLTGGLIIGIVSAIIGILPSVISPAFKIQGMFLLVMLTTILATGFFIVFYITQLTLKKNFMISLREE
jgi:ABC-type antimicrobial peptide transport system permease subunit